MLAIIGAYNSITVATRRHIRVVAVSNDLDGM